MSLQNVNEQEGGERYPPSAFERAAATLTWLCAAAAAVIVLFSLALTAYSVLLRYVFNAPVTWSDELSGYLVVAMVMLGAAESLRRGDHINVDLLTSRLNERARRYFDLWAMLLVIVVGIAFIISAAKMVHYSYSFGIFSEGYLEMPMWLPQSIFLFGSILLVLMAVCRIVTILASRPS